MNVPAEVVQSHLSYHAWASGLLVEAASRLSNEELTRDFGTADKSVLGTLVHVFGADRVWLAPEARARWNLLDRRRPPACGTPKGLAGSLSAVGRLGRGTDRRGHRCGGVLFGYARKSVAAAARTVGVARGEPRNPSPRAGFRLFARHGTCAAQAGPGPLLPPVFCQFQRRLMTRIRIVPLTIKMTSSANA